MSKLEGSWTFTLERPAGGLVSAAEAEAADDGADAALWPLSRVQYRFCMWPKGECNAYITGYFGMHSEKRTGAQGLATESAPTGSQRGRGPGAGCAGTFGWTAHAAGMSWCACYVSTCITSEPAACMCCHPYQLFALKTASIITIRSRHSQHLHFESFSLKA